MNDNMAAGAIEAIKGFGATTYPLIYGVDGTPEACLLIKDGKMASTTAYRNPSAICGRGVQFCTAYPGRLRFRR